MLPLISIPSSQPLMRFAKLVGEPIEFFIEVGRAKVCGELLQIIKLRPIFMSKPRIITPHPLQLIVCQAIPLHIPEHDQVTDYDVSVGHSNPLFSPTTLRWRAAPQLTRIVTPA